MHKPFSFTPLMALLLLVLAACGQQTTPQALPRAVQTIAISASGTVVGWGENSDGQVTIPAGLSNVSSIAGGSYHSLALKNDGTVVGWGDNSFGQATIPAGLSNVSSIAAGRNHSLALKNDGTVVGWGTNVYGQLDIPAGLSTVSSIAAGSYHNLALKSDGTVVGWGYNAQGQTTIPTGLSNVVAIAAGLNHSLALKSDGSVVGWGYNFQGQTTIPTGLSNAVAIAAGLDYSLALKSDGTVVGWGRNDLGQTNIPAGLSNVSSIAAGAYHSLALVTAPSDTTPPTINITTPSEGAKYLLGQTVNANYSCSDDTAIATCLGTVANSAAIDTASVGAKTFVVNATDSTGNIASKTVTYQVIYNFRGFFQPVDSLPTLNQVKAGQSIPIKFSLSGNQGLAILASGSPSSQQFTCSSSTPVDDIEQTVTAGNSTLSYDAASDTYTYIWKTEKGWSNTCRQLVLTLADGMSYRANFKFK